MTCTHFWLTDSKGFARCKHCGKTKQYKQEKIRINPNYHYDFTRKDFAIHPDLCTRSYVRVR